MIQLSLSRRLSPYRLLKSPSFHRCLSSYDILLPPEPFVFGVDHIKTRSVPKHIARPSYVDKKHESPNLRAERIRLRGGEEKRLRRAAQLARRICDFAGTLVKPGITTEAIDAQVHAKVIASGAYPSPLHYNGFPKACCTSVNNVMVHGIPDERPLKDGDIINIDITVYLDGFHGDTSRTFTVGSVDDGAKNLINLAELALQAGISACAPGKPYKAIGRAIHNLVKAQEDDFCISPQFTGHGIGTVFHRPPWILHHLNDEPGAMLPGDCFTIEPNIIEGTDPQGALLPDGWTVVTESCARSAQAEDMVLITENGAEVITV